VFREGACDAGCLASLALDILIVTYLDCVKRSTRDLFNTLVLLSIRTGLWRTPGG
jgi:hypothetical protein